MEINTNELNEKVIGEQGMLYYLVECTDFLCDLPEWMYPHIEAELADKKSMHRYYEEAKGNRIPTDSEGNALWTIMPIKEEVEKTLPCFNANDGHEYGTGDCTNLVAIPGQICSMECAMSSAEKILNEDAPKSNTWPDEMEDPLLTIIIFEDQGIPEIAFAGSDEAAKKVWKAMMREFHRTTGEENCEYTDATIHDSWDAGFFGYGEDIYRVQHRTLNDTNIPMEIADGDKIRAIRPGTKMPVTILTTYHSGIPETWFVGSEKEAKKEWDEAMKEIEEERDERAKIIQAKPGREDFKPDYSCDEDYDGERTTKNAWEAGYFCDHKTEYRVDAYNVEVA